MSHQIFLIVSSVMTLGCGGQGFDDAFRHDIDHCVASLQVGLEYSPLFKRACLDVSIDNALFFEEGSALTCPFLTPWYADLRYITA
jgi:hypothetical protein